MKNKIIGALFFFLGITLYAQEDSNSTDTQNKSTEIQVENSFSEQAPSQATNTFVTTENNRWTLNAFMGSSFIHDSDIVSLDNSTFKPGYDFQLGTTYDLSKLLSVQLLAQLGATTQGKYPLTAGTNYKSLSVLAVINVIKLVRGNNYRDSKNTIHAYGGLGVIGYTAKRNIDNYTTAPGISGFFTELALGYRRELNNRLNGEIKASYTFANEQLDGSGSSGTYASIKKGGDNLLILALGISYKLHEKIKTDNLDVNIGDTEEKKTTDEAIKSVDYNSNSDQPIGSNNAKKRLVQKDNEDAFGQEQSFYFYPDGNVYLKLKTKQYTYNDGKKWVTVTKLPTKIMLEKCSRAKVYYDSPNVYLNNDEHRKTFLNKRQYLQKPIVYLSDEDVKLDDERIKKLNSKITGAKPVAEKIKKPIKKNIVI